MPKKIKIAIFQNDLNIGGIQRSLVNLLNSIDISLYEVDLYLTRHGSYTELISSNVNIKKLRPLPVWTNLIPFSLTRLIFKHTYKYISPYDIAIDFNGYKTSTSLAAISTRARKKIIWIHNDFLERSKHDLKFRIKLNLHASKYKHFDKHVFVSAGIKRTKHNPTHKSMTINNMIDVRYIFEQADKKFNEKFNVSDTSYNLISVSRLTPVKRVSETLNIIAKLINNGKRIHLYIVGSGPLEGSLEKHIRDSNLSDHVTMTGALSNPFPLMNLMDGFISTSSYEGQGMTTLEAKCLGLDIFIPRHLEKYLYEIEGSDDLVYDIMKSAKKENKLRNNLAKYNKNILEGFEELARS